MAASEYSEWVFLVPGDPGQRTGGYTYVREMVAALRNAGQPVQLTGLAGEFPRADAKAKASMESVLAGLEPGTVVILDGLAVGGLPSAVAQHRKRLRLIALVHHPLADETGLNASKQQELFTSETEALASVQGVITTSAFTAEELKRYQVPRPRLKVVEPAVAEHPIATGPARAQDDGLRILCVATLSPRKAQHQLVDALAELAELPWHCVLAGSTERSAAYADEVAGAIRQKGLTDRFDLTGELDDEALNAEYARADLFVLPSLYEGYGMVIDEALARGLPVITSDGGALAQTGARPGVDVYPAGETRTLQAKLRELLTEPEALAALRGKAVTSRQGLRHWREAARQFQRGVAELLELPERNSEFAEDWLGLREPADHRSRDTSLVAELNQWLGKQAPCPRLVDLGSGAGSNLRYLLPRLSGETQWLLLDQDAGLLRRALQDQDTQRVAHSVERLTAENLSEIVPRNSRVITASALIDLVSDAWLEALGDCARARGAAVYIALSYCGWFRFGVAHPLDEQVLAWVNDHQCGEKGSGQALGPDAWQVLVQAMEDRGYRVLVQPSSWQLFRDRDRTLALALLDGWAQAAREQQPDQWQAIGEWAQFHREQLTNPVSDKASTPPCVEVGHQDVLALPETP